jgi:hypothetical protein
MNVLNVSAASVVCVVLAVASIGAQTPAPNLQAAADQIVKSDAAFAQSVAEKDRTKFLSFIADMTTFNVMKGASHRRRRHRLHDGAFGVPAERSSEKVTERRGQSRCLHNGDAHPRVASR